VALISRLMLTFGDVIVGGTALAVIGRSRMRAGRRLRDSTAVSRPAPGPVPQGDPS
jgi:hypothetical protein